MADEGNGFYSQGHLQWFQKHGKALPYHQSHTEDSETSPLSKKLKRLEVTNWRLEGNLLIGDTEMGPLKQFIPSDYICKGTDENGLPILTKIKVK